MKQLLQLHWGLVLIVTMQIPSAAQTSRDLTEVSLEDLMNIRVTSVSKKEQKLAKTGAPVTDGRQRCNAASSARERTPSLA